MRGLRMHRAGRQVARGAAAACALAATSACWGVVCDWTNPAGGAYGNSANWNNGAGPIPGAADQPRFALNNTYTTIFTTSPTTGATTVTAGDVTFVTNGAARTFNVAELRINNAAALHLGTSAAALHMSSSGSVFLTSGGVLDVGFGNDFTTQSSLNLGHSTFGGGVGTLNVSGTGLTFPALQQTTSGFAVAGAIGNITFSSDSRGTFKEFLQSHGTTRIESGAQVTNSAMVGIYNHSGFGPALMTVTGANSRFTHTG